MEIVVRAAVVFLFLWILVRGLGKRELAQMSPFELIVLVTMGDVVQQGVTQEDMSVTGALIAVSTLGLLAFGFSYVAFRWPRTRRALDGAPTIVLRDGRVLEAALRSERLDIEDVKAAAREQGISDLAHVRLGILEPEGHFSFLRDDERRPSPAPQDRGATL